MIPAMSDCAFTLLQHVKSLIGIAADFVAFGVFALRSFHTERSSGP